MASEALFQALAGALSRPSRAYRAASAALDVPKEAIGGYEEGLQLRQNINSARFLNTPLSDVFSDQGRIPYGLKPNNTVGHLMNISKTLSGYIPPEVTAYNAAMTRLINKQMGGGDTGGSGGGNPPAPTPTPNPDPNAPAPVPGPSVALVTRPSAATTPVDPNADLNAISGTGADSGGNVAPGAPAQPGGLPEMPSGGMGSKAYQMMLASQKTGIQAGQFFENQRRERSQFATSEAEHERMHQEDLAAARGRATASAISTHIAPQLQTVQTLSSLLPQLEDNVSKDTFIPIVGGEGPAVASKLGQYGPDLATTKLRIQNIGTAVNTILNKIFVNRYNSGEANQFYSSVIPGPNDPLAKEKMANLNNLVNNLRAGKLTEAEAIADSLAGRKPNIPGMGGAPVPKAAPAPTGQLSPAAQAFLAKHGGAPTAAAQPNGNP